MRVRLHMKSGKVVVLQSESKSMEEWARRNLDGKWCVNETCIFAVDEVEYVEIINSASEPLDKQPHYIAAKEIIASWPAWKRAIFDELLRKHQSTASE